VRVPKAGTQEARHCIGWNCIYGFQTSHERPWVLIYSHHIIFSRTEINLALLHIVFVQPARLAKTQIPLTPILAFEAKVTLPQRAFHIAIVSRRRNGCDRIDFRSLRLGIFGWLRYICGAHVCVRLTSLGRLIIESSGNRRLTGFRHGPNENAAGLSR